MSQPISMAQTFNVELGARVAEGLGTIGRFDGKNPNFVAATASGLVLVHDPNENNESGRSVRHHNINRPLTSIGVCTFADSSAIQQSQQLQEQQQQQNTTANNNNKNNKNQVLLFGSPTSLLVYDIHNNADVFYKEISDGVNSVTSGKVWKNGASAPPTVIAFAGGNGSVQGFDHEGQESWWTVAGDNVGSVAVVPTSYQSSTIAVGSDDFEIRFYAGEMLAGQVTETAKISHLVATNQTAKGTPINGPHQLGYTLANGTIGVYGDIVGGSNSLNTSNSAATRKWRYKSKNTPNSIAFGDVDLDGVEEMLVGWSNGRFEVRATSDPLRNGECIFKDTLAASVATVAATDYRGINREMPLVSTVAGELCGFVPVEGAADRIVQSAQQLEKLMEQKTSIEHELQAAQRALTEAQELQQQQEQQHAAAAEQIEVRASILPNLASSSTPTTTPVRRNKNPHKRSAADYDEEDGNRVNDDDDYFSNNNNNNNLLPNSTTDMFNNSRLELVVSATGGAVVHSVIARSDVIFGANDSVFVMNMDPHTHGGSLAMNIETVKDLPGELNLVVDLQRPMSVVVSSSANNAQFESRTFSIKLPKFCMYAPLTKEHLEETLRAEFEMYKPRGVVTAKISERASRVATWAQSSFIGFNAKIHNLVVSENNNNTAPKNSSSPVTATTTFEAYFKCLRRMQKENKNNNSNNNKKSSFSSSSSSSFAPPLFVGVFVDSDGYLRIECDDVEIAGEFLQDLASYMSITDLASTAKFPQEFGSTRSTVEKVNDLNEARLKLTAEMADSTQLVKSLLVKLEDTRTLSDFQAMRKTLDNLYEVNRELMGEHLKRSTNHTELLSAIKSINHSIQLASRLRVGEAKNNVVNLCRNAVKEEKMNEIVPIFESGVAA